MEPPATVAPLPTARSNPSSLGVGVARSGGRTPIGGRAGSTQPEAVQQLHSQIKELSNHLEGLEKERDFYFEKVGLCSNRTRWEFTFLPSCGILRYWFSNILKEQIQRIKITRLWGKFRKFSILQRCDVRSCRLIKLTFPVRNYRKDLKFPTVQLQPTKRRPFRWTTFVFRFGIYYQVSPAYV
jgi:hypothetical protein